MNDLVMANLDDWRRFYAEEIRLVGNVKSATVVEAFARVPREKFLGPPPWQIPVFDPRAPSPEGMNFKPCYTPTNDPRDLYHNILIGLDAPQGLNNGQPSSLAYWIDALELKPGERVYHLGCGVGYYTAIIAEVVGGQGSVVGSEVHAELGARAMENLAAYANVKVEIGEAGCAPFDPGECDAMLINAGMTHPLPIWLDRLRDGGRMVVPLTMSVASGGGYGTMAKIIRSGEHFSAETIGGVGIFSAIGLRDAALEGPIKEAIQSNKLAGLKSVRRDPHDLGETCILHTPGVCISSADANGTVLASVIERR
jgi:protein-L-isoaspartate(D-aspartate) O-methyltransferase